MRPDPRTRKLTAKAMANLQDKRSASNRNGVAKNSRAAKPKAAAVKSEAKSVLPSVKRKVTEPTAAAPKKPKAPEAAAPALATNKRKAAGKLENKVKEAEEAEEASPAAKKAKVSPEPRKPRVAPASRVAKHVPAINSVPTKKLDVYVFGEGSSGELGLGSVKVDGKKPIDVTRPRLNGNLLAESVGVVQVAVGGMHSAALTHDNKVLTWGVNDQGALGRDTKWEGGLKDIEDNKSESSESDDDDDDTGMNPMESTPAAIDSEYFSEDTKIVQVVASDSATFALTEDGSVYGWGTFRSNDGILGFTEKIEIQSTPMKLPGLKKITSLAAGSNHVLALDSKGNVFAWGNGQQNQLGRRILERFRLGGLVPREFGLPKNKIVAISCGAYHSFAISKDGRVWAWGLNNFGETGIADGAGEDNAVVGRPTVVSQLADYQIKEIRGGGHHSLACTEDGKLLVWGRADSSQAGMELAGVPDVDLVRDEHGRVRIVTKPTVIPGIHAVSVAAGSDNSFAIDADGKAYSWGFSANYQTGQGSDDDVEVATMIDNTAVRGKKIVGAGAGGQFSVLTGLAEGR